MEKTIYTEDQDHQSISDAAETNENRKENIIINDEQESLNYEWESTRDHEELESVSNQSSIVDKYSTDFPSSGMDDILYQWSPEEKAEPNQVEQIVDTLIAAFTVRKRKTFIDHEDNDEALVSYETSEERVIVFAIILAMVLSLSSAIMLIIQFPYWLASNHILVIEPEIQQVSYGKSSPHVVFIFRNGNIESFQQSKNLTLEHSWNFKVPQSQNDTGHFIYSEFNQLFIFFSDGRKDITVTSVVLLRLGPQESTSIETYQNTFGT